MKKLISSAIILFVIVILQSCSSSNQVSNGSFVQKRKYNKGWHTNLNFHKNNPQNTQSNVTQTNTPISIKPKTNYSNQFTQDFNINIEDTLVKETENTELSQVIKTETLNTNCDKIYLYSGEEIEANILEITDDVIKYKKCNNESGPLYTKSLHSVVLIIFKDGSKQIIEQKKQTPSETHYTKPETKQSSNETEPTAVNSLVMGILSLILWPLGIFAIVFGATAFKRIERNKTKGKNMANWGVGLGVITLIWSALYLLYIYIENY